MARQVDLGTREKRSKLATRHKPYWREVVRGKSIGYRKGKKKQSWSLREFVNGGYTERPLGLADDDRDVAADGVVVLSWEQAQRKALELPVTALTSGRGTGGTVAHAAGQYWKHREERDAKKGRKDENEYARTTDKQKVDAFVLPTFGEKQVAHLTTEQLNGWLLKQVDTRMTGVKSTDDVERREEHRKARATVHRIWNIFRAILNDAKKTAKRNKLVLNDDAWTAVEPLQDFDQPRKRSLSMIELRKLIAACDEDFGKLVRGAFEAGTRYSETIRLRTADFDGTAIQVRYGKSKHAKRRVILSSSGAAFFRAQCRGKGAQEHIFLQASGKSWESEKQGRASQFQKRRMATACVKAKIAPATFHDIRRSNATLQINAGGDLQIISNQLGHANVGQTRHAYAHLFDSTVQANVQKALPAFEPARRTGKQQK